MDAVISGIISGLVGGSLFGLSMIALYAYEKSQARKAAKDIVNNLKSMYADKVDQVYTKSNTNKFN